MYNDSETDKAEKKKKKRAQDEVVEDADRARAKIIFQGSDTFKS
jgi:hypothetical protein